MLSAKHLEQGTGHVHLILVLSQASSLHVVCNQDPEARRVLQMKCCHRIKQMARGTSIPAIYTRNRRRKSLSNKVNKLEVTKEHIVCIAEAHH